MENANQSAAQNTSTAHPDTVGGGAGAGSGGGDFLDKAVDFVEKKVGHEQGHSTTEKISDGIRKGYQKVTGKEVPVKDKEY